MSPTPEIRPALPETSEVNFRDYLRLLQRSWILIVVLVLLGAAAGFGVSAIQTPQYSSTAKAYVSTPSAASISDLSLGTTYTQQILASFADISTTSYVLRPVIDQLNLKTTPLALAQQVTVTAGTNEAVLDVTVVSSSAKTAAAVANAIVPRLGSAVDTLTPDTDGTKSTLKITQVDPAIASTTPTGLSKYMLIAIGALAGIVVGVALAVLREIFDTRLRGVDELERITEVPILGATVRDSRVRSHPIITEETSQSVRAESFRTLRSNLEFLAVDDSARSFVVTSSVAGEGKSTSAANLALSLADLGKRVVLVDADLRRPRVADYLQIEGAIGMTDVLIGRVSLDNAMQTWGSQGLSVLTAGPIPPNPNELLQSRAMSDLIETLQDRFDVVVFDAPPLLPVSDAAVLARHTSGAIVIAAIGTVRRAELAVAINRLEQSKARVLGLVVTMLPARGAEARTYGQYGYAPDVVEARATFQPPVPRSAEAQ